MSPSSTWIVLDHPRRLVGLTQQMAHQFEVLAEVVEQLGQTDAAQVIRHFQPAKFEALVRTSPEAAKHLLNHLVTELRELQLQLANAQSCAAHDTTSSQG